MHINKTFNINANIKNVYKCLYSNELKPIWMKGLEKIEVVENDPEQKFVMHIKEGNKVVKYNGKTLEIQENKLIKTYFENEAKSFGGEATYTLKETENNTCELNYTFNGFMKTNSKVGKFLCDTLGKYFSILILNAQMKRLAKLAKKSS